MYVLYSSTICLHVVVDLVKYHEQFLSLSLRTGVGRDQSKAYRGLGLAHKNLGNLQEALVIYGAY